MDSSVDEPDTTEWCAGGCTHYGETKDGRTRYEELKLRYAKIKEEV